jgi:signal transduction histidine kinase
MTGLRSFHWGSVRVRTALAAGLAVAVVLGVAAVAGVLLQRHELTSAVEMVAEQAAESVAADLANGAGRDVDLTTPDGGDDSALQVVDASGRVLAASPALDGDPAISTAPEPGKDSVRRVDTLPTGEDDPYLIVTVPAHTPDGPVYVASAQNLEDVEAATASAVRLLAVGYPVLVLLVGLIGYWLAGRALAPVDAMRRRVGEITADDLSARLRVGPAQDEIAGLAATMNDMLTRLETSARAQQRFVTDASHELRSPIATIRTLHEVAAGLPQDTDWKAVGADVLLETQRLEAVVTDLLLLARTGQATNGSRPVDVDLAAVLRQEAARPRRVPVRVGTTDKVHVLGDPDALARALRNLLDNAERHARTCIDVDLSRADGIARIDVHDDGHGIAAEDREKVFERFVRLDEARTRDDGGSGLGLAITREIARAHRGDVTVENSSEPGATVRIQLPVTDR